MNTVRCIFAAIAIIMLVTIAWLLRIDIFDAMERDCNDY